jgi:hypothetical protein
MLYFQDYTMNSDFRQIWRKIFYYIYLQLNCFFIYGTYSTFFGTFNLNLKPILFKIPLSFVLTTNLHKASDKLTTVLYCTVLNYKTLYAE